MIHDMTRGKPFKLIASFAFPLLIGNLFQQLYNMVDTVIVGQFLGKDALAAVGSTGAVTFLVIGFINGVAEGACIPIAQYFGAGDKQKVRRCIANMVVVYVSVVSVLTVAALVFNRPLLRLMRTPENIMDGAADYLKYIYIGMFATMLYNMLAGLLRALGDSRSPLYFLIIAAVLNVVLDLFFIVVVPLGVAGAAIATVLSQLVSGILCLLYIKKRCADILPTKDELSPDVRLIGKMLFMGLPVALQYSITAIGNVVLQTAVNSLGSDAVAAMTVAGKLSNIVWLVMNSVGVALANYCGQNIGAGDVLRVKKGVRLAAILDACVAILLGAALYLAGSKVSLLFLDASETVVIELVDRFIKIESMFYVLLAMIAVFRNAVQGMGYSVQAMTAGVLELVGRAGVALALVGMYGYTAACIASPVAWVLADLLLIPLYLWAMHRIRLTHHREPSGVTSDA